MQQLLRYHASVRPAHTSGKGRWGRLLAWLALLLTGSGAAWGQTLTNYALTPSSGTFTAITGTSPGTNSSTTDDDYANGLPIGFQFVYMGTPYTTVGFSTNGWLSLGGTLSSSAAANGLSANGTRPVIAPLWDDLDIVATSNFSYQTTGTAGSRVFTAQWKATKWYYNTASLISFQVKLYESDGSVQLVYSPDNATAPGGSASVGITSATTGSGSYLSLGSLGAAPTVSSTTETNSITAKPAAGQTYTFTAPAPAAPTGLTFSSVTATSMSVAFTDASTTESKFLVQYSSSATFATYGSATVSSTTTAATGATYSTSITGLSAGTTYYYRVVAIAEGPSAALTGSQATAPPVPLCGTYAVGPTGTYASLTAAFQALNINGLTCAVVLELQSTYASTVETLPIAYTFAGGSATNTVTVRPAAGATGLSITGASTSSIFNVSGGKYLVLDGRPGGSGTTVSGAATATDLTVANTSTSGIVLNFASDAQYNTVQHCQVKGVGSSSYPNVNFSSTVGSAGNSNNTLQYNNVGDGASTPAVLVYSGSATNASNTIANNNLFNFYYSSTATAAAVYLSGAGSGWVISGNSLYQTASRTGGASTTHYGLYLTSGTGANVSGNYLGGSAAQAGGSAWTVSGTAATYRFVGIYAGGTTPTVQGNVIANMSWLSSSGATTYPGVWAGIYAVATTTTVQNNTVGSGVTVTISTTGGYSFGIVSSTAPTTLTVSGNTVGGLTGAGSTASIAHSVVGIQTNGTTNNVLQNKVYGLAAANAGVAYGIHALAGTTTSVYNNLVGNLTAPASTVSPAVAGFYVGGGTTVNAYYNTIYLPATTTSSGTGFGAAGVYASTSPTLTLIDNIVVNAATPTGTGVSAAYRRSSTTLTSYGASSNNNLFFTIAAPTTAQPLYYDGTNTYATLTAYKTAMATRDQASVTENPPFANTATGSASNFLHLATGTATQAESGGVAAGGVSTDYDGDLRYGATGYAGAGSAPDIGADEGNFTPNDQTPPTITYAALANTGSTANRTLTVTITDASGLATGLGAPRIYYKLNTASGYYNAVATGSSGSTYTFTIDYANIGGTPAIGTTIQYYVAAQDASSNGNVATSPAGGSGTNPPGGTAPAAPNSYQILQALAGDYYVLGTAAAGSSPGGASREYATLTAAVADYNSKGLTGPVRFWLFGNTQGTETYPINVGANGDASATNTLTIKPYAGVVTTFTNATATSTLKLTSAAYVTLDGSNTAGGTSRDLTLSNTSTSATAAALVWLASTTTAPVTTVAVRNLALLGAANSGTSAGVMVSSTTYNTSTGGSANGVTIANNAVQGTSYGVVVGNDATTPGTGLSVTGNLLGPATASATANLNVYGIFVNQTTAPTLTNNTVRNLGTNSTAYGIYLGTTAAPVVSGNAVTSLATSSGNLYGIYSASASSTLSGNTVSGLTSSTYAYGIYLASGSAGTASAPTVVSGNKIYSLTPTSTGGYGGVGIDVVTGTANAYVRISNNFVADLHGTGYTGITTGGIVGILLNGSTAQSGISLYHNSVYLSGTYAGSGASSGLLTAALGVTAGNTGLDVRNNIFDNGLTSSGGTGKSYAFYSAAPASAYTSNYNDYYVSGNTQGVLAYFNGADVTTLAGLQSASTGTGQDGNSTSLVDPQFASATDLHTTNAALAVGTPVSSVPTDIDGEARSTTAPYLGADEFVPVAVDAQPTALVAPSAGTACYGSAEAVTVAVKNGSTTAALDFAANPVTVTVQVTGQVTQTFTQTYTTNAANGSSPLAAGATVNLTLPGTLNMSATGTYSFAVTATAQGDQKTSNDVLATQTRTVTAPALTNISASTASICGASGPVTLTATGVMGGTVTWYSSADGYAAAIGTGSPFTTTVTSTTSFRANVVCGASTSANSNVVTVTVSNPTVTSTNASPATICGSGTSTITAGAASGTTVRLYSAATGGTLLATGTAGAGSVSYATPTLSASTTYYAEAATGTTPETVGKASTTGADGAYNANAGLYFTTTGAATLAQVTVYQAAGGAAGTVVVELRSGSSTSGTLLKSQTFTLAANSGSSLQAVNLALSGFDVPAAGSYTLAMGSASTASIIRDYTASFPYGPTSAANGGVTITDGTVGGIYYFFYNWVIGVSCAGSRTAIPVTVTPATALTPANTTQTVCAGGSTTITFSGYSTLSVSPAAGTVVSGQNVTFTPPLGTTTYTVTGTDGTCSNTATVALTSTTLSGGTATATSAPFCAGSGGSPTLAVSNVTGQVSFVWQASATGAAGSFASIAGSDNQTTYTAPAITATTYYQVLATCGSLTATSTVASVAVANPGITATNSPATRCGAGTVTLTASGSPGTTPTYYAAASGGQPLGSGSSYTATVTATPATQTFYVAARDNGTTTYVAGLPNNAASYGTFTAAGGSNRTLGFDVSQGGTLTSVDVYPSAAGSVNILVYAAAANPGATGTLLATVASPAFTAAQVGTRVTVPLGVALTAGSYKLSASTLGRFTTFTGTYPYATGPLTIQGSYASATATTFTSGTYNSFFNVTFDARCESARTGIDVNVTTPPSLTYTGSTAVCAGSSTVLTFAPASYTVLSVSPTTGTVVNNAAHTITFSPAASTSYTVTGTDGNAATGCTATAAVSITVNPAPNAPTLTPPAATICAGNSTTVTAASTGSSTVTATVLNATFNAGPDGFTTTNTGTGTYGFARQTPPYNLSAGYPTYNGLDGTPFFNANADKSGSGTTTTTTLTSPVFDLTGYTAATLAFQQFYGYYNASSELYARVQISTDGTTWTNLASYTSSQGSAATPASVSLAIPAAYLGSSTVQVRFAYSSAYGFYWNIDNVSVAASRPEVPTYAVTPGTGATVSGSTITFNPLTTTTYQVTASYANGCASPATPITITVNTATTWTGAASSNWFASANWSNCVPTRYTDATIPAGAANYPNLNTTATAEVKSLTLASGSQLDQSAGTLNVYGNLTDNAPASDLRLTGGMLAFVGASPQLLGTGAPTFYNLMVNLGSGSLTLGLNTYVTHALTMQTGVLNTGAYVLRLDGATIAETDASYVTGNVNTSRVLTAGTAESFGGLGLTLTPAAGSTSPSRTEVTRVTGTTLTGQGTSQSIQRYFDIQPLVNTGLNVQLDFSYFDHERNGIAAANMQLFKSTTGPGGPWERQLYTTVSGNTVSKGGITDFSVWTLGDGLNPLPVQLVRFEAQRRGADAALSWTTASELGNRGFEVQVSADGQQYRALGFVAGAGSSSVARTYGYLDQEAGKAGVRYYRLKQLDLSGQSTYSPVRALTFEVGSGVALAAQPNPFVGSLTLHLTLPTASPVALTLLDALGRPVRTQALGALPAGTSQATLDNLAELASGVYLLRVVVAGSPYTLRVVRE